HLSDSETHASRASPATGSVTLPGAVPSGVYSDSPKLAAANNLVQVAEEQKISAHQAAMNASRSESAALPQQAGVLTGRVSGYVNDSVPNTAGFRSGLSGVAVQAYSL